MGHSARASCQPTGSVGSLALRVLATSPSGTVLSSHSRAAYLLSASGELMWLAPSSVPMHRRGIRVTGVVPRTTKGSVYRIDDARLQLGAATVIDFSQARVWGPERGPAALWATAPGRDPDTASWVLRGLPSPTGFGAFLPELISYARGGESPSEAHPRDPVLAMASPSVFGIARACRERDGAALLQHAEGLVGLGLGLTPSGDDFVGGVLFSLALLRAAGERLPGCSPGAVASFLEISERRTNRISFALLGDHAAGHSCEPAHRLALGFLGLASPGATSRAASDLVRVGHSTGWDLLTGIWTASAFIPMDRHLDRGRAEPMNLGATS